MIEVIEQYVNKLQEKIDKHHKQQGFTIENDKVMFNLGGKFAKIGMASRIDIDDKKRMGSAYAFIALEDGETKGLGKIKKGDLFKPASFNSPAKHARGNIIDDMIKAIEVSGVYGVEYLR